MAMWIAGKGYHLTRDEIMHGRDVAVNLDWGLMKVLGRRADAEDGNDGLALETNRIQQTQGGHKLGLYCRD